MDGALAGEANVEAADLDELGHATSAPWSWKSVARWNAAPIRSSMASSNERPISCMPTGRPLRVKPDGNRQRRQTEIIDRAGEARQPLDHGFGVGAVADIALGNGGRRDRRHRRDHGIDAGHRRKMRRQRRAAPAHRFEIGDAGDRKPVLQPHQDLRAVILRTLDQPALVERGGFDGEHQLAGRGELALVRQFDLNDIGALALEHRDRLVEDAGDFGIEIVDIERRGHADGQAFDRLARRGHVIRHRPGDRGRIVGIRARHQAQQQRAILRGARQRPDGVERLRQRHRAGAADPARRWSSIR